MKTEHVCDERCNCPECGSHCHYSPRLDLHACSNIVHCRWKEESIDMSKIPYHRIDKSTDEWLGFKRAGLAELADAPDLKSEDATHRESSILSSGTINYSKIHDFANSLLSHKERDVRDLAIFACAMAREGMERESTTKASRPANSEN